MIVVMKEGAPKAQIDKAVRLIETRGLVAHRSTGVHRVILGVVGDLVHAPIRSLEKSPGVERIVFISEPPPYFADDAARRERWSGPPLSVAVVGVGLIGGSAALALRNATPHKLTGCLEPGAKPTARMKRLFDSVRNDASAMLEADLVLFAAPVAETSRLLRRWGPKARPGSIWSDMGSVKAEVCREARRSLARGAAFVGGHPMAGSEKSGFEHARADLFEGATYALTPVSKSPKALALLKKLVRALGAKPLVLSAEEHDRIVAVTSHLPQFVASSLAAAAAETVASPKGWLFAGQGLRDTTRLADSNARMWSDVALHNRSAIAAAFKRFEAQFALAGRLTPQAVGQLFKRAHGARAKLYRRG